MEINLKDLAATRVFGQKLASRLTGGEVIFLIGDLGAGKTTLTQQIAQELGVKEIVNSPTFTLVKEYHSGRLPLIHLDLYRLQTISAEDEEMVDEYDDGKNVLIIEWGEQLLPDYPHAFQIRFTKIKGNCRTVELQNFPPEWQSTIKSADF